MTTSKFSNVKRGTCVKILNSGGLTGRIVDIPGPFGGGGMLVYRVLLRKKPKPAYVEVREDQLELLPEK